MDELSQLKSLDVSTRISPLDTMFSSENIDHYFYVGRSNLWTILNVVNIRKCYHGGNSQIRRIFDFGCGHGRITRYIRAYFQEAELSVTDFDQAGVEFCVENFASVDTRGEVPREYFDLVFLSSVFTHLPVHIAEPLLQKLLGSLRENGVLVFTTQGRYSVERMKQFDWEKGPEWMHYNLSRERFEAVIKSFHETGYGYVDYPDQKDYGVCIAQPSWYAERALAEPKTIQILFQEKGSDNHQDVSAFMKASILDHSKGPLW